MITAAVFFMKTAGATNDDQVGIMTAVGFQWQTLVLYPFTSNYRRCILQFLWLIPWHMYTGLSYFIPWWIYIIYLRIIVNVASLALGKSTTFQCWINLTNSQLGLSMFSSLFVWARCWKTVELHVFLKRHYAQHQDQHQELQMYILLILFPRGAHSKRSWRPGEVTRAILKLEMYK